MRLKDRAPTLEDREPTLKDRVPTLVDCTPTLVDVEKVLDDSKVNLPMTLRTGGAKGPDVVNDHNLGCSVSWFPTSNDSVPKLLATCFCFVSMSCLLVAGYMPSGRTSGRPVLVERDQ